MGPPSSGGVAVLQILGLLEHFDMAGLGPTADGFQALLEASKLAFADRNLYLADADFVRVPLPGLLDQAYLTARAQQIRLDASMEKAAAGNPPWREAALLAPDASEKLPGTSHLVIVDAEGNAAVDDHDHRDRLRQPAHGRRLPAQQRAHRLLLPAGSRWRARSPTGSRPASGRAARWRRRSCSTAQARPMLLIGSPGGSQIIGYVAQALVGVLDWGLTPQQAVSAGHVLSRNGPAELEAGTEAAALGARSDRPRPEGAGQGAQQRAPRHRARERPAAERG